MKQEDKNTLEIYIECLVFMIFECKRYKKENDELKEKLERIK